MLTVCLKKTQLKIKAYLMTSESCFIVTGQNKSPRGLANILPVAVLNIFIYYFFALLCLF